MGKDTKIIARCTTQERKALALIAEAEERTSSDMLRVIIRREATRHGVWPPTSGKLEVKDAR